MIRSRRMALLVMLYVSFDLANPMMPGAVQLVGASLETVAGCQSRTVEGSQLARVAAAHPSSAIVPRPALPLPTPRSFMSVPPPAASRSRTFREPGNIGTPSPEDG